MNPSDLEFLKVDSILHDFLSSNRTEHSFPPIFSAAQRNCIKRQCKLLGLFSKSHGKNKNRYVFVRKENCRGEEWPTASANNPNQSINPYEASTTTTLNYTNNNNNQTYYNFLVLSQETQLALRNQTWLPIMASPSQTDVFGLRKEYSLMLEKAKTPIVKMQDRLSLPPPQKPSRPQINKISKSLLEERNQLPIYDFQQQIMDSIDNFQVTLIVGETGSGKSTQVPQFILNQASLQNRTCRIIVTEPRRIAALTLAERCAIEWGENVSETIGYQIRLESKISPKTLLTFCTNGILLRTLIGAKLSLHHVTHLIIDEVHERDKLSDFLLTVLKFLLPEFPMLKLILMSASLNKEKFMTYFENASIVEVPGRTYPVEEFYLEDILKELRYNIRSGFQPFGAVESEQEDLPVEVEENNVFQEEPSWDIEENLQNGVKPKSNEPTINQEEIDAMLDFTWEKGGWFDMCNMVNAIKEKSLPLNCRHSKSDMTPLSITASRNVSDFTETLLELGAGEDKEAFSYAYQLAYQCGSLDTLKVLAKYLQKKVNPQLEKVEPTAEDEEKDDDEEEEEEEFGNFGKKASAGFFALNNNNAQKPSNAISVESGFGFGFGFCLTKNPIVENPLVSDYLSKFNLDDQIDIPLIVQLLNLLMQNTTHGAILIFLPGYEDIVAIREKISMDVGLLGYSIHVCMLHSQMQPSDQREAFLPVVPGFRKVILSTNIAEVSVTINDVVYVLDCGKMKEKLHDSRTGISSLSNVWISKANALQRKGRAGRCSSGVCYRLYSNARFECMSDNPVPELLRVPIHEVCLQTRLLFPEFKDVSQFLAYAPDPPPNLNIKNSVNLLKLIGAFTSDQDVTLLGRRLAELPLEPQYAKMILFSVLLRCLDPVLTIIACLSGKDPFILPKMREDKASAFKAKCQLSPAGTFSDHLVYIKAYDDYVEAYERGSDRQYCNQNFISAASMNMVYGIRGQIVDQLKKLGFLSQEISFYNENSKNWAMTKLAILAGSYPSLAFVDRNKNRIRTKNETLEISCYSTLLEGKRYSRRRCIELLPTDWIVFNELTRVKKGVQLKCATAVTPLAVSLVTGSVYSTSSDSIKTVNQQFGLENWDTQTKDVFGLTCKSLLELEEITFETSHEEAQLVMQLREKLCSMFIRLLKTPWIRFGDSDLKALKTLSAALDAEEQRSGLIGNIGLARKPNNTVPAGYSNPTYPNGRGGYRSSYYNRPRYGTGSQSQNWRCNR